MSSNTTNSKYTKQFSLGKLSLSVLTALFSLSAVAAENEEETDKVIGLERIEVTAQKRSQTLLEVPASLSAFNEEQLVSSGIQNVLDLANFTPGLSVEPSRAGGGSLYVRGIGTNITGAGSDPSVAVYHNGAYVSRHVVAFQDFIDVERVEVLRGPQGTLYGRNATGGAINVIHKTPDGSTEVAARVDVGNFDTKGGAFAIGGTLVEEKLYGRVSIAKKQRDSYFTNAFLDNEVLKGEDSQSVSATLVFEPTDNFSAVLRYKDYTNDALGNTAFKNIERAPLTALATEEPDDPFVVNNDYSPGDNTADTDSLTLELEWDIGNVNIKSITATRDIDTSSTFDTDGTFLPIGFNLSIQRSEMLSQELQVSAPITDDLYLIAGLFYYDEEAFSDSTFQFANGPAGCVFFGQDPACVSQTTFNADNETKAYAAFTELTYTVNEDLRMIFGARYSDEEKSFETTGGFVNSLFDISDLIGLPAGSFFVDNSGLNTVADEDDWSSVTGRFVVEYDVAEDILLYGSVSEGFKSGGFNSSDTGIIQTAFFQGAGPQGAFDPEQLISYEMGLKGTLLDNRLSGSISAFLYDYEDLQVRFVDSENGTLPIRNAAEAEVLGLEIEGTALITDDFKLEWMLTVLDTEYKDFGSAQDLRTGAAIDLSGESLIRTPDYKMTIGAEYTVELGSAGYITGRIEYLKQSEQKFGQSIDPFLEGGEYSYGNARLTWSDVEGEWYVAAWVQNFNDDVYESTISYNNLVGGTAIYGTPRTYGLTVGYNY